MTSSEKQALTFLEEVFKRHPKTVIEDYWFDTWEREGKPTEEGIGVKKIDGLDPEAAIRRVMDVDHYVNNIAHVAASRGIKDDRFSLPKKIRFYQKVNIPVLGDVQHELVLVDAGTMHGYRVAYWYVLRDETDKLSIKDGYRSDYNVGAWLAKPGYLGYALSSAPKRDDVGWMVWQALTTGADLTAKPVIEGNIEGMAAWSLRMP